MQIVFTFTLPPHTNAAVSRPFNGIGLESATPLEVAQNLLVTGTAGLAHDRVNPTLLLQIREELLLQPPLFLGRLPGLTNHLRLECRLLPVYIELVFKQRHPALGNPLRGCLLLCL